jgi:hypothetical protein
MRKKKKEVDGRRMKMNGAQVAGRRNKMNGYQDTVVNKGREMKARMRKKKTVDY